MMIHFFNNSQPGEPLIKIDRLPFFCGLMPDPLFAEKHSLPYALPFVWGIDQRRSLLRQFSAEYNRDWILAAYQMPVTIAPPLGEGDFGGEWVDTIVQAIIKAVGGSVSGKHVLEFGCANGFVLKRLQDHGAICVGVEPGIQGKYARDRFGLDVRTGYFEQMAISGKFDLVYSINVLEHIFDIDILMAKIVSLLSNEGVFFAGVPNSAIEMSATTPNIFVHEHIWYFTPNSLTAFFYNWGLINVAKEEPASSSNFFVWGQNTSGRKKHSQILNNNDILSDADDFRTRLQNKLRAMQRAVDEVQCRGKRIGLYGASNAVNFLGLLDWSRLPQVFDSDSANHGKYLCSERGKAVVIDSPTAIESDIAEIWVLPCAHQLAIRENLLARNIPKDLIRLLSYFCSVEHSIQDSF